MRELTVTSRDAGQRLDKYLNKYLNKAPRSLIYRMLRKKNIKLNGKKASGPEILAEQDHIQLFLAEETINGWMETVRLTASRYPDILYEDEHIVVLNKPEGLLTQRAAPQDESLVDQLLYYLADQGQYDPGGSGCKPSVCNRLDRNTSGLVLAGKDQPGLQFLSKLLRDRELDKYYLCLVAGSFIKSIRLQGYLKKDRQGNRAVPTDGECQGADFVDTEFEPVVQGGRCSLVRVRLITGKSHQIRSQIAAAGYPVVGDPKYGDKNVNQEFRNLYGLRCQLLHSAEVVFPKCPEPFSYLSESRVRAPLPKQFAKVLKGEHIYVEGNYD
ncbi:MAG TPA: RluA family pseudouridine synthase [Lachnospiraceae bacterium]|nr:RluA family pseudouridine synthase [Lachnospiraceae bacterium]